MDQGLPAYPAPDGHPVPAPATAPARQPTTGDDENRETGSHASLPPNKGEIGRVRGKKYRPRALVVRSLFEGGQENDVPSEGPRDDKT